MTVDDPKAYTKPWTVTLHQRLAVNTELVDEICLENEKVVSANEMMAPHAATSGDTRCLMKRNALLSVLCVLTNAVAYAQIPLPPGASAQSPQDPGYQALIASCETPPPPPPARGGGPEARRQVPLRRQSRFRHYQPTTR